MGKKTIPILIGVMSLALLDIVFIQYEWIEGSFDETQDSLALIIEHNHSENVMSIESSNWFPITN